jgi:predicted nucleotidyltransferase component of viral defense system
LSAETRQRILEAQTHFGLTSPALVEKDLYVEAAIRALAAIDAAPFSFVYGGGTSLARAHKLIRRMSEDIDFKIVLLPGNEKLKSGALKRGLSALKHSISAALSAAGFQFNE